ncbi:MAG: hypothetical protein JOY66_24145, partial [Acetobacteraceae bacterium]|nr:hypothetical protein [Acetobacteraceae bacterium]
MSKMMRTTSMAALLSAVTLGTTLPAAARGRTMADLVGIASGTADGDVGKSSPAAQADLLSRITGLGLHRVR